MVLQFMLDLKKLEQQLDEVLAKETKESLTNWLLEKRTKNKAYLSYLGDGCFAKESLYFDDEEKMPVQYNNQSTSQQKLEADDLQNLINDSIDLLPEKCRLVFTLSRFEEMTYQEIANELNISIKTVENQISKALKFLRKALKQDE